MTTGREQPLLDSPLLKRARKGLEGPCRSERCVQCECTVDAMRELRRQHRLLRDALGDVVNYLSFTDDHQASLALRVAVEVLGDD